MHTAQNTVTSHKKYRNLSMFQNMADSKRLLFSHHNKHKMIHKNKRSSIKTRIQQWKIAYYNKTAMKRRIRDTDMKQAFSKNGALKIIFMVELAPKIKISILEICKPKLLDIWFCRNHWWIILWLLVILRNPIKQATFPRIQCQGSFKRPIKGTLSSKNWCWRQIRSSRQENWISLIQNQGFPSFLPAWIKREKIISYR